MAVDIDLFLEYVNGDPSAFIEYKEIHAQEKNCHGWNIDSINRAAIAASLPFFLIKYERQSWDFYVYPQNSYAWDEFCEFLKKRCQPTPQKIQACREMGCAKLDEQTYVRLMYWLRGLPEPSEKDFERLARGEKMIGKDIAVDE